ncbi:hypothetical protein B0H16DRAFT_1719838 [Mycena metata]|uniref:Uncharacterized protein n=1 Tax=Mycena metata TaxID=1033252 RepID=A0AAD7JBF2_9AGAR|nr:hypothetical protein B0H16DRAFT_1719838 [Mycena metata]
MRNHKSSFLGAAQYDVDFIAPDAKADMYLKATKDAEIPEYFSAVLFGAVSKLPTETYGGTSFEISCPDWSSSGWSASSFKTMFKTQFQPLDSAAMADISADYEDNRMSALVAPDRIIIDIWNRYRFQFAWYEWPDVAASGSYFECPADRNGANFPFAVGDTVVIGANLSRVCVKYGDNDRVREYHILGNRIKSVRPAEAVWTESDEENRSCDDIADDGSDGETIDSED